ncbi:hypothetical protein K2173_024619 [Erythroxylum novogranatense]|uniref:SRR1-like domain-containing protein n=1 Tax=Erythroxylum novogranatense TaxID=1862640 RepID=A0AAV8SUU8_9ROSI|nr:hypothetical protein K2173_024619 [Erythroxylum novogranatense]
MATSAKVHAVETSNVNGDWTIVVPRRGKQRRKLPTISSLEEQQQVWVPTDLESDQDRQSKLMQKMQICLKKVESSQFYHNFVEQIQNQEILDCFSRVLRSELKMETVIYGIGSIELYETPRLQLSLAILMKRKFSWIGDIEVFDPILSVTETDVLKALGCSVMSINEQGRRLATKPTLFYMPHCEAELYNNLLQANWGAEHLNHFVLFGNSFEVYQQYLEFRKSTIVDSTNYISVARKFTDEYAIRTASDEYFAAFHDSSWHFFSPQTEEHLQLFKID